MRSSSIVAFFFFSRSHYGVNKQRVEIMHAISTVRLFISVIYSSQLPLIRSEPMESLDKYIFIEIHSQRSGFFWNQPPVKPTLFTAAAKVLDPTSMKLITGIPVIF